MRRDNGAAREPHSRPKPIPVEDEPGAQKRKERIARRHAARLHAARMGDRHLPWPAQHDDEPRCSNCGTEATNCTEGCTTCWERTSKARRRAA